MASIAVADGENGLRAVAEHQPDMVVLDLSLAADRTGSRSAVASAPMVGPSTLPVIVLTAHTSHAGHGRRARRRRRRLHHQALPAGRAPGAPALGVPDSRGHPRAWSRRTTIVVALANAVEAKDLELKDHCRHLAYRAARLAAYVGLRDGRARRRGLRGPAARHRQDRRSAEHVLHKPGPLTDDEFRIMREHPEIGERICDPLRLSRDFAPIIRHHHERWDGSRLPRRPARRGDPARRAHRRPRRRVRRDRPRPAVPGPARRRKRRSTSSGASRAASSTRASCRSSSRRPSGWSPASRRAWTCHPRRCSARRCRSSRASRAADLEPPGSRADVCARRPAGPRAVPLPRTAPGLEGDHPRLHERACRGPRQHPGHGCLPDLLQPPVLAGPALPRRRVARRQRRLYIFGPREQDIRRGLRNHAHPLDAPRVPLQARRRRCARRDAPLGRRPAGGGLPRDRR